MGGYGGQRRERGGHGQQTGDSVCGAELEDEGRRVNQRGGQKAAASETEGAGGYQWGGYTSINIECLPLVVHPVPLLMISHKE